MPDVPDLSKLAARATAFANGQDPDQPAEKAGPPCSKCGLPTAPISEEMQALVRSNPGVDFVHEVCPTDTPAKPEGRYFEVRVSVVEVTEVDEGDGDTGERDTRVVVEEMISFIAGHRAANLNDAMRPLALALGEKWAAAEKRAPIADSGDPS